jgi:hypothetical protein
MAHYRQTQIPEHQTRVAQAVAPAMGIPVGLVDLVLLFYDT